MVRFTSWKPQGVVLSNPAAFARSSRVKKAKTRGDSVIGDPEWRISPLEMADKAAEHK